MKLLQRFVYYAFGFIIGMILLFFFLGGKEASCDYSPNARVLKNIRIKERIFSDQVLTELKTNSLDTSDISLLLRSGNVNFDKSNTAKNPCNEYVIEGLIDRKNIGMVVQNCDSVARVNTIQIIKPSS